MQDLTENPKKYVHALEAYGEDKTAGITTGKLMLVLDRGKYTAIFSSVNELVGQVHPIKNRAIKGIVGVIKTKVICTVKYTFRYENAKDFNITIDNNCYLTCTMILNLNLLPYATV